MQNEDSRPNPAGSADNEGLIRKGELARRLKKAPRTIDVWMRKGYLPYFKIEKAVLFRWSAVLCHLENRFRVNG